MVMPPSIDYLKDLVPETNKVDDKPFDRIYGSIWKGDDRKLIQKDGTVYKGKIEKKSIRTRWGFLSHVYKTEDNRYFDRCGLPIDKPSNLVKRLSQIDNDNDKDNNDWKGLV
jgi:hypothetical protein